MNKAIPLLVLLVLVATALLLLISSVISTAVVPSPFLIAATIVATVALFGAVFSLYTEKRSRTRCRENRDFLRKR